MKTHFALLLVGLLVTTGAIAEVPIRVHCAGEGTKSFEGLGSEEVGSDRFYEFYQDRMTEKVNASTLKYTKEEIIKKSDDNYGVYKVE